MAYLVSCTVVGIVGMLRTADIYDVRRVVCDSAALAQRLVYVIETEAEPVTSPFHPLM